jgi:hypothetical protein
MSDEFLPIYPNIKRTMNVCKFKYTVLEIKLFESIRIAVYLYNENDMLIEANQILIQGAEYNAWSNDDKYIINLIKTKIPQLIPLQ